MPTPKPKTLKCKTCGRSFSFTSVQSHPSFPFCSERCQAVDLGRWFNGDYVIPGHELDDLIDELSAEGDGSASVHYENDA